MPAGAKEFEVNSKYTLDNKFRQFHFNKVSTNYQALRRAEFHFTDDLLPVCRLSGLEAEMVRGSRLWKKGGWNDDARQIPPSKMNLLTFVSFPYVFYKSLLQCPIAGMLAITWHFSCEALLFAVNYCNLHIPWSGPLPVFVTICIFQQLAYFGCCSIFPTSRFSP